MELTVAQLVNILHPPSMKNTGSLPYSQQLAAAPFYKTGKSSHTRLHFNIILQFSYH